MRTIVALLLATLALTGCGVRLDAPDPTPTSPTADEAIRQREALRAADVPCELLELPRTYHGADSLRPSAPSVREMHRHLTAWLRPHLGG